MGIVERDSARGRFETSEEPVTHGERFPGCLTRMLNGDEEEGKGMMRCPNESSLFERIGKASLWKQGEAVDALNDS